MYASEYYESKILNLMRGTNIAYMTNLYVGLFNGDPGDDPSDGTPTGYSKEVEYNGYARQRIVLTKTKSEGTMLVANNAVITFPNTSGTSVEVTHVGVFDGNTRGSGNLIFYGPLSASIINEGGISFPVGNISWSISGSISSYYLDEIVKPLGTSTNATKLGTPSVALFSGDPYNDGEELPSSGGYKRVSIGTSGMSAPVVEYIEDPNTHEMINNHRSYSQNLNAISFPTPTDNWNTVTHVAITSSSAVGGGNVFASFELTTSIDALPGDIVMIPAGSLKLYVG